MDWVDEKARGIVGPFQAVTGLNNFDCDVFMKEITAALRQARGDIAGEVCPHWTVAMAKHVSAVCRRDDGWESTTAADELDMLIEQVQP